MNDKQVAQVERIMRECGEIFAVKAFELVAVLSVENLSEKPAQAVQPQKAKLLTKKELADYLQIRPRQINDRMNEGMPFIKFGRNTRFDLDDVLSWAKNKELKSRKRKTFRVVK